MALLQGCSAERDSTPFTADAQAAAASIDDALIRRVVAEIASDDYRGRAPGSEGDAMARAYLAGLLDAAYPAEIGDESREHA